MKKIFILFVSGLLFNLNASAKVAEGKKVVQINLSRQLNARSVTTLSDGKLITWTKGIDGNGEADGYLTKAAAIFKGDIDPNALPDNPLFPANDQHPQVLLHYTNGDGNSNQTVAITHAGSFSFKVPPKHYSSLFFALTSSEGASQIKISLHYTDGIEFKSIEVPDYYMDIAADNTDWCYLAHNLAKWGKMNQMTENDHHNIDLLNVHPNPNRRLKSIQIEKSEPGYLVFWGATGLVK
ncbi:MAG TPA: hypothetical protein DCL77_06350 [Prolixibacteraceae bacterium]|jgi:hypothetical protein|nr:hypothetical protein [Prolixibacteraceae bacterium]